MSEEDFDEEYINKLANKINTINKIKSEKTITNFNIKIYLKTNNQNNCFEKFLKKNKLEKIKFKIKENDNINYPLINLDCKTENCIYNENKILNLIDDKLKENVQIDGIFIVCEYCNTKIFLRDFVFSEEFNNKFNEIADYQEYYIFELIDEQEEENEINNNKDETINKTDESEKKINNNLNVENKIIRNKKLLTTIQRDLQKKFTRINRKKNTFLSWRPKNNYFLSLEEYNDIEIIRLLVNLKENHSLFNIKNNILNYDKINERINLQTILQFCNNFQIDLYIFSLIIKILNGISFFNYNKIPIFCLYTSDNLNSFLNDDNLNLTFKIFKHFTNIQNYILIFIRDYLILFFFIDSTSNKIYLINWINTEDRIDLFEIFNEKIKEKLNIDLFNSYIKVNLYFNKNDIFIKNKNIIGYSKENFSTNLKKCVLWIYISIKSFNNLLINDDLNLNLENDFKNKILWLFIKNSISDDFKDKKELSEKKYTSLFEYLIKLNNDSNYLENKIINENIENLFWNIKLKKENIFENLSKENSEIYNVNNYYNSKELKNRKSNIIDKNSEKFYSNSNKNINSFKSSLNNNENVKKINKNDIKTIINQILESKSKKWKNKKIKTKKKINQKKKYNFYLLLWYYYYYDKKNYKNIIKNFTNAQANKILSSNGINPINLFKNKKNNKKINKTSKTNKTSKSKKSRKILSPIIKNDIKNFSSTNKTINSILSNRFKSITKVDKSINKKTSTIISNINKIQVNKIKPVVIHSRQKNPQISLRPIKKSITNISNSISKNKIKSIPKLKTINNNKVEIENKIDKIEIFEFDKKLLKDQDIINKNMFNYLIKYFENKIQNFSDSLIIKFKLKTFIFDLKFSKLFCKDFNKIGMPVDYKNIKHLYGNAVINNNNLLDSYYNIIIPFKSKNEGFKFVNIRYDEKIIYLYDPLYLRSETSTLDIENKYIYYTIKFIENEEPSDFNDYKFLYAENSPTANINKTGWFSLYYLYNILKGIKFSIFKENQIYIFKNKILKMLYKIK